MSVRSAEPLPVRQRGACLLRDPALNKGTAFTREERDALGLTGLLPPRVSTLGEQVARVAESFRAEPTALDRYLYLRGLQDRNETLFFAALMRHLEEMAPIIYTPTVAEAVQRFSHIFRSSRGLYITPDSVGQVEQMLRNAAAGEVGVIVCTDNEGILGIGDQGVGGIGIPIGKLALYVAAGGFAPSACLPVCLDVGTENEQLLSDPAYLGVRSHRLDDAAYVQFIDAFVHGTHRVWPRAVLQWEDFSRERAFGNLDHYRELHPSFNDDIQGTAAVVHAALLGALRLAGRRFAEETICIVGAGDAGVGVGMGLIAALCADGVPADEAHARVHAFDTKGLVVGDRPSLPLYKRRIAMAPEAVRDWDGTPEHTTLQEVIEHARPGVLIGLSGRPGSLDEATVRLMAAHCERPVILALSNPSANVDAHPHDLVRWTGGRAIVATGSPFEAFDHAGRVHRFSQANNVYVFPGLGAGAHLSGARRITDAMLVAAGTAVHAALEPAHLQAGLVLPPLGELRPVAIRVAAATWRAAAAEGVAAVSPPPDAEAHIAVWQYVPEYRPYVPA